MRRHAWLLFLILAGHLFSEEPTAPKVSSQLAQITIRPAKVPKQLVRGWQAGDFVLIDNGRRFPPASLKSVLIPLDLVHIWAIEGGLLPQTIRSMRIDSRAGMDLLSEDDRVTGVSSETCAAAQ